MQELMESNYIQHMGIYYLNSFRQDTITVMINGDYLNQMIKYD